MPTQKNARSSLKFLAFLVSTSAVTIWSGGIAAFAQSLDSMTPVQHEIASHRARLSSAEVEERRDAVMRLHSLHHPEASRAAIPALKDPIGIVRATAAAAVLSLPPEESASYLIPLLNDKDEFVRREAAYALGKTQSDSAVSPLVSLLLTDKEDGVRGAAAVALGEIQNAAAVLALAGVFEPQVPAGKKSKKTKREQNPLVLRAAAHSLGQIGSVVGVPTLIKVLQDDKAEDDVRREAATALGMIGSTDGIPALRATLTSDDPYLVSAALAALDRISRTKG